MGKARFSTIGGIAGEGQTSPVVRVGVGKWFVEPFTPFSDESQYLISIQHSNANFI
jgi:hypothetical protein